MQNNVIFFKNYGPFSLEFLSEYVSAQLYLDNKEVSNNKVANVMINNIASLSKAADGHLSFLSNIKYKDEVFLTNATACILEKKTFSSDEFRLKLPKNMYVMLVENAYFSFARISSLFYPQETSGFSEVSTNSFISKSVVLGKDCRIMDNSYIGKNVRIGDNVIIYPNVFIGDNVVIGNGSVIHDSVSLRYCLIGERAIIHPGVRIGQDGFGYAVDKGQYIKVPQIGSVIIGNDVEIGANSTIDRGTIEDTIIGDMTKIDNLVQIGHNVIIGKNCFVVSQAGIAGSTKLGNYVVLGGQVGVAGHLNIGDYVQVGGQSGIMKDIDSKEVVWGCPSLPIKEKMREIVMLKKLINKDK
ncbi:MAG: UDP-3-O-(3-hydroxymyristoyl)glucosamine N-acyltransferase [Rickettsiales bacterium]|nr:UDP-3-O-(3-hydroxymyristoyl)glucosamine N-acyltransferase [Rickettsiales bacterium]